MSLRGVEFEEYVFGRDSVDCYIPIEMSGQFYVTPMDKIVDDARCMLADAIEDYFFPEDKALVPDHFLSDGDW